MPTSLFIEQHANGFAFYINGDLQFDTADEAIYHEYLVVPAIALAAQRFPQTPLLVLICGGGDGLAARDVLRFSQVSEITLVDYDPEVLALGRTVFKPFNRGSLSDVSTTLGENRLTVRTQEAFEFVSNLPDACYHAVICDFTFPTRSDDAQIYSREWFQQVKRVLCPNGVMSTNGVSPEQRTLGFWCLYQTLLAAGLHAKPLQIAIPSFRAHGYGDWGFFLASAMPVTRSEVETLVLPELEALQPAALLQAFQIPTTIAQHRHTANIHTLDCPQLFYYLLNPRLPLSRSLTEAIAPSEQPSNQQTIDFLDLQEIGTGSIGTRDLLQLDSIATVWLEQLYRSDTPQAVDNLMPTQHRYHSKQMSTEWLGHLKALLEEVNLNQLVTSLLERAQELPPQLVRELKQLVGKIRTGQPLIYSEHTAEVITLLSVTLLMANIASPDVVFAKGYSSSSGSYSSYDSDAGDKFGWLGFWTMMIGGIWLWNLYKNSDD